MIMYVRIVTFALAGITGDDYHRHAAAVAEAFTAWPGLLGKVWLGDRDRNRYGGVYLFATKVDADRSRSTPLFAGLAANPAYADLVVEDLHKAVVAALVEGAPQCDWVLIDAGNVIVHVFRPEVRAFYNLEKMWMTGRPAQRAS